MLASENQTQIIRVEIQNAYHYTTTTAKGILELAPFWAGIETRKNSSRAIPAQLKCDSCMAVAYQIHETFSEAHKPWSKKETFKLSEAEVLDVSGEKVPSSLGFVYIC